jgi:hypothetical protein
MISQEQRNFRRISDGTVELEDNCYVLATQCRCWPACLLPRILAHLSDPENENFQVGTHFTISLSSLNANISCVFRIPNASERPA